MYYVIRGINHNKKEVFHGVSEDPDITIYEELQKGIFPQLKKWNFEKDDISWIIVTRHVIEEVAYNAAKDFEITFEYYISGYSNIISSKAK